MAQSRPGAESGSLSNGHSNKGESGAQQNDAAGPFSILWGDGGLMGEIVWIFALSAAKLWWMWLTLIVWWLACRICEFDEHDHDREIGDRY